MRIIILVRQNVNYYKFVVNYAYFVSFYSLCLIVLSSVANQIWYYQEALKYMLAASLPL